MNDFICNHPFIFGIIITGIPIIIILVCIAKPWYKYICHSKTDGWEENTIEYNIFNKSYYYCHNDHYSCVWRDKMTNTQLKEYGLIENTSLINNKTKIKIKPKMENSKSSLLLKILKHCLMIIIIILTYKIGVVIIETIPNLVKNQLTTIQR
jgi:hypothetical protein